MPAAILQAYPATSNVYSSDTTLTTPDESNPVTSQALDTQPKRFSAEVLLEHDVFQTCSVEMESSPSADQLMDRTIPDSLEADPPVETFIVREVSLPPEKCAETEAIEALSIIGSDTRLFAEEETYELVRHNPRNFGYTLCVFEYQHHVFLTWIALCQTIHK